VPQAASRLRLVPPAQPEQALHEAVAKLLVVGVLPGTEWTHFPAGSMPLDARWAAKLYRMGLKRGWPDFLILHATRLHGLELKRRGGELSRSHYVRTKTGALRWIEGQDEVLPRLEIAGAKIAVCDSLDGVIAALRGWHIPLRKGISL
jgi:hypothetical protein